MVPVSCGSCLLWFLFVLVSVYYGSCLFGFCLVWFLFATVPLCYGSCLLWFLFAMVSVSCGSGLLWFMLVMVPVWNFSWFLWLIFSILPVLYKRVPINKNPAFDNSSLPWFWFLMVRAFYCAYFNCFLLYINYYCNSSSIVTFSHASWAQRFQLPMISNVCFFSVCCFLSPNSVPGGFSSFLIFLRLLVPLIVGVSCSTKNVQCCY